MRSRLFRAVIALGMALTFALNGSAFVFAEEKTAISYEIEYGEGRTYLTLTPSSDGNTIRYTTDGSKPGKSSKRYGDPISTKKNIVVRASEYDKNGKKVASVQVELKLQCAKPKLTAKKTEGGFLVTLSSETKGSAVYYTTDGSKPGKNSAVYKEPFFVKAGTTVRAYASKSGYQNSDRIKKKVEKSVGIDPVCEEVLGYINGYRAEEGVSPLAFDEKLLKAAQIRAEELAEYYSHDRPDGTNCLTVFGEVGFSYRTVGENIAWTEGSLSTAATITEMWYNSPTHRKNILNGDFELTGIASFQVGNTTYWVQLFGTEL